MIAAPAAASADEKWNFEDASVGAVPKGWIVGVTGSKAGKAPKWEETKNTGLLNRLIAEKDRPRADVFRSGDLVRAAILKSKGVLASYPSAAALARSDAAQMPLRSDVPLPDDFPFMPVSQLKAMSVDYGALADTLEGLSGGFLKQWVDENQ